MGKIKIALIIILLLIVSALLIVTLLGRESVEPVISTKQIESEQPYSMPQSVRSDSKDVTVEAQKSKINE